LPPLLFFAALLRGFSDNEEARDEAVEAIFHSLKFSIRPLGSDADR